MIVTQVPAACFLVLFLFPVVIPATTRSRQDVHHHSSSSSMPKPMQDPNLFQGDMILPAIVSGSRSINSNGRSMFDISGISLYSATTDISMLWPDANIFYQFGFRDPGLRNLVKRAMDHISAKTCIKFTERGILQRFLQNRDYVTIFRGKGCYSMVGKSGGAQPLSLGPGCENESIIVHELMHAIGFFHKHSRSDRDDYIQIHWDNIDKKMWPQFEKLQTDQNHIFTPFDYMSIMLYGPRTFSIDDFSTTMSRKDGGKLIDVQFKNGLSKHDIENVRRLYNCPKKEADLVDSDDETDNGLTVIPAAGSQDNGSDSEKKVTDRMIESNLI